MKLVTGEQMRRLDRKAMDEFGIPGLVLMENAGRGVGEVVKNYFNGRVESKRILIFAGKGNNGGDGFVVGRHLANCGADVKVFLLSPLEEVKGDALINLKILKKMDIPVDTISKHGDIHRISISLLHTDLVVDAIFGTGFLGKPPALIEEIICVLNDSSKPIIAVDLPSGLMADTGKVEGSCIKAHRTCTFGFPKLGLYLHPGSQYSGEIDLVDISIPSVLAEKDNLPYNLIDEKLCSLPPRDSEGHKGTYGHVYIVGGSVGMSGAVGMASSAALRGGAGLVTACVPHSVGPITDSGLMEIMTTTIEGTGDGVFHGGSADIIADLVSNADAVVVGPGMSEKKPVDEMLLNLLPKITAPLVIDADALNIISENISIFSKLNTPAIITPYPGEMARLMGCGVPQIQGDRLGAALQASREWDVIVVLKGAGTIIAAPDGRAYLNNTGNPGMATAGMGDVLAGLIASFLGQGMGPLEAAAAGVYVHGKAGDRLIGKKGHRGMVAGDILKELPNVIVELERRCKEGDDF
ncbi:MAG: NAD(P)H-hydrate dehydratase [Clostridia bacterium]|nr:NAD(P)H-hydrate dehydratase [Clostridia bacterium]